MKLPISIALLAASASAFAPASNKGLAKTSTALKSGLNGWTPDQNRIAYGLPGAIPPFEDGFDPLGLSQDATLEKIKYFREAELQHGRVAMLAVLGFVVTENPIQFHPLFEANAKDLGPAIYHLDEVRSVVPIFFEILAAIIGFLELNRAIKGWKAPTDGPWVLEENYYPGDVDFDPLGLKPTDPEEFAEIATKELQNGRLAMLAAGGFIAQELVNGKEIFVNLGVA